ncbi:hypothetical protein pEaSNUABM23_00018 [Erwinia phage pEa_SNUABM_23]|nr:hypothetical protein pEaSNUABM20_00018 [Erwinia phage pEa_SNUABM_20]UAW52800.1 hypothetical protein pEaSNUABM23_00018 [Erwinia phage pEa_SNUABM_23]UIW10696.1 hypothetical protein pEaSNUABM23_00018 [Erwinia phage pEa_SNUABM_31]
MSVIGDIYNIPQPYAMYCGNAKTKAMAKITAGMVEWAPEKVCCVVEDAERLFADVPCVEVRDLDKTDAETLVIGFAPFGGQINDDIDRVVCEALKRGLNVAAALHVKLADNPKYFALAREHGVSLYDFRHHPEQYPLGTGIRRDGIRVLTVGTDCSCGKKFTALALTKKLTEMSQKAVFCATGQTGFLISGRGINNDTVVADFLAGAAEWLSPDDKDAIYLIEGQGAIRHPAYTGGSMSLIAGSQPDALVMCHTVGRNVMMGTEREISITDEISANLAAAAMHDWYPRVVGISINFCESGMSKEQRKKYLATIERNIGYVAFDPQEGGEAFDRVATTIALLSRP